MYRSAVTAPSKGEAQASHFCGDGKPCVDGCSGRTLAFRCGSKSKESEVVRLLAIALGLLAVGVNAAVAGYVDPTQHYITSWDVSDPNSNYSKSFLAITNPVPKWLDDFLADRADGVEASEAPLIVDGKAYEGIMMCKPHACDSDFIFLYYSPNGGQAWGVLKVDNGAAKLLGAPDQDLAKALLFRAR